MFEYVMHRNKFYTAEHDITFKYEREVISENVSIYQGIDVS